MFCRCLFGHILLYHFEKCAPNLIKLWMPGWLRLQRELKLETLTFASVWWCASYASGVHKIVLICLFELDIVKSKPQHKFIEVGTSITKSQKSKTQCKYREDCAGDGAC